RGPGQERTVMDVASQTLPVLRGPYELHTEMVPGTGTPVVLMHGFPDNTHLYDRLVPQLAGRRPVVRFDFLGWGRSDKPQGYPYTAPNQWGDRAAVIDAASKPFGGPEWVLVAARRIRPAGDRLGASQPWPGCEARVAEHLLPLDPGPAAPASHRVVLHAGHPHGCPRHCPAAAGRGPAA